MALMMQLWFSSSLTRAVSAEISAGKRADHRGVGRAEDHGRFAVVEAGQSLFQFDVRLEGAVDEPHRARTGAVLLAGFLLGGDDVRAQGHAQVGVRVHLEEFLVAETLEQIAVSFFSGGLFDARDDDFSSLERAFGAAFFHGLRGALFPICSLTCCPLK